MGGGCGRRSARYLTRTLPQVVPDRDVRKPLEMVVETRWHA